MKNKKLFICLAVLISCIVLFNFISAEETIYNTNYGQSSIQISSLKYEPYPVNPGEYFDIWIKAYIPPTESGINYAKFELVEDFPFSLDSNEEAVREYDRVSGIVIMNYKVRVDVDVVEGINNLKLEVSSNKYSDIARVEIFEISVANAQTDFDLVVQDLTSSEVSLAIANIGKNTANSMIVRIPEQTSFKVTGTNGQMIGNLESGDYTVTSFSLILVGKGDGNLTVQIDYTDNIGERRSVLKEVQFDSQSSPGNITGVFPGGAPSGNMIRGDFPNTNKSSNVKWYIMTGILAFVLIGLFIYSRKFKKSKEHSKNTDKKNSKEEDFEPEWIKKVKEKERK
jgi:LPXTG-motif cell wall-anchored protein